MKTVLMSLRFVFVLETVMTVLTRVWFTHSVDSVTLTLVSRDYDAVVRVGYDSLQLLLTIKPLRLFRTAFANKDTLKFRRALLGRVCRHVA